jgi:predicted kinase
MIEAWKVPPAMRLFAPSSAQLGVNMFSEPLLILMCGLSFAGKTTIARALATKRAWRYLSLDAINTERGVGLDGQPIPLHEWEQTYAEAYRRVEACLRDGQSVVYDETNMLRAQRDQLRTIAARYQVPTYVLYVATSGAEARRRWQDNRQRPQRGDVRDDNFAYVIDHFEVPTSDEAVIQYNALLPLQDWIRQVFPVDRGPDVAS